MDIKDFLLENNQNEEVSLKFIEQPFKSISNNENYHSFDNIAVLKSTILSHIDLIWKNTNVIFKPKNKKLEEKTIIHEFSGIISSGEFLALMGATGNYYFFYKKLIVILGSGKTTFLNYLSGRLSSNELEQKGTIILNNEKIVDFSDYNNIIGYVTQEDILLDSLTPKETLFFSAKFKLCLSNNEINAKVNQLINELELSNCQNSIIGSVLSRGISGGERKRTCIAVELISDPKILFLDEPTTGLDSRTALKVVELLKRQKNLGRLVISTIHQPSSEIFECFDKLMLLYEGHCVYYDHVQKALPYFEKLGYECPKFSNPAEFLLKIIRPVSKNDEEFKEIFHNTDPKASFSIDHDLKKMCVAYNENFGTQFDDIEIDKLNNLKYLKIKIKKLSVLDQFFYLYKRCTLNLIRNPSELKLKTMTSIFVILFSLALFYNMGLDDAGGQNRLGLLFFILMIIGNMSYESVLLTFSMERPLFIKEQTNKLYGVGAYFWARNLCEFPLQIIIPFIFTPCIYFACNLNNTEVEKIFIFILITMTNGFACESLGLINASISKNIEQAAIISPILILPPMLFAGFFIKQDSVPVILIPFKYASIFKYTFQAYVQNEFNGLSINAPETYPEGIFLSIIILIILAIGFRLIAFGIMKFYTSKLEIFKK